jgi:lipoprotein-anchoring transpeptidase ErfK/SrfK
MSDRFITRRMSASQHRPALRLVVTVSEQRTRLWAGDVLLFTCVCSTSKYGLGNGPGTYRTPLGRHIIAQKIGDEAPWGTIFKSREPVGVWKSTQISEDDLITTRVMWLRGLERQNDQSFGRYIYLHGTNQEHRLGTAASHGCVRMSNDDITTLYSQLSTGDEVVIRR